VLHAARGRTESARLDLLNVRLVRDVQALTVAQMEAALGATGALALWREARGLDAAPARAAEAAPGAIAEETLAAETNDRRVLAARLERLAAEVGVGLRARRVAARRLALVVTYADGRGDRARRTLAEPVCAERGLRDAALALLDRAVKRRVRVRRLRLEAWEGASGAQLSLWDASEVAGAAGDGALRAPNPSRPPGPSPAARGATAGCAPAARADALEAALDRLRARFGTETLVPASWMAHGVAVRPPARP
jgi:DNA polymerase-4